MPPKQDERTKVKVEEPQARKLLTLPCMSHVSYHVRRRGGLLAGTAATSQLKHARVLLYPSTRQGAKRCERKGTKAAVQPQHRVPLLAQWARQGAAP